MTQCTLTTSRFVCIGRRSRIRHRIAVAPESSLGRKHGEPKPRNGQRARRPEMWMAEAVGTEVVIAGLWEGGLRIRSPEHPLFSDQLLIRK